MVAFMRILILVLLFPAFSLSALAKKPPPAKEPSLLAAVVNQLQLARTPGKWIQQLPSPVKKEREKIFAKIMDHRFPPMFVKGNSVFFFFDRRSPPEIVTVEKIAWSGFLKIVLNGVDFSFLAGESETAWMERNFKRPKAAQYSLLDWIVAPASAEAIVWQDFIRAAILLAVKDAEKLNLKADEKADLIPEVLKTLRRDMNYRCVEGTNTKYRGASFAVHLDGMNLSVSSESGNIGPLVKAKISSAESPSLESVYVTNLATGSFSVSANNKKAADWNLLAQPFVEKLMAPKMEFLPSRHFRNKKGEEVQIKDVVDLHRSYDGCKLFNGIMGSIQMQLLDARPDEKDGITHEELWQTTPDKRETFLKWKQIESGLSEEEFGNLVRMEKFLAQDVGCTDGPSLQCTKRLVEKCQTVPAWKKVVDQSKADLRKDPGEWRANFLGAMDSPAKGDIARNLCYQIIAYESDFSSLQEMKQFLGRADSEDVRSVCGGLYAEKWKELDLDLSWPATQEARKLKAEEEYKKSKTEHQSRVALRSDGILRMKDFANVATACCRDNSCREILEAERAVFEEPTSGQAAPAN